MPSNSYLDFLELLEDVNQLRTAHVHFNRGTPGKKKLGYLTRSAIVMLCAAWERYNENIILECINNVLISPIQANHLPTPIKQYISSKVKENKNEIYPIQLADSGWKNLWIGYATNETETLNTPNSENLKKLFKRYLGISDVTTMWHHNLINKIDDFIRLRGEIAHNGSKAKYVRYSTLASNIDQTIDNVIQIDFSLSNYLRAEFNILNSWELTYFRSRTSYRR